MASHVFWGNNLVLAKIQNKNKFLSIINFYVKLVCDYLIRAVCT